MAWKLGRDVIFRIYDSSYPPASTIAFASPLTITIDLRDIGAEAPANAPDSVAIVEVSGDHAASITNHNKNLVTLLIQPNESDTSDNVIAITLHLNFS